MMEIKAILVDKAQLTVKWKLNENTSSSEGGKSASLPLDSLSVEYY